MMLSPPLTADYPYLQRESAEAYHSQAGTYLSSHLLNDFRRCPHLYHRKRLGLVSDEDRPAYLVGRAAHTVILEGRDAFHQSFAVGGPVNPKTGLPFGTNTKAFAEWAEAQSKDVLTAAQHELVGRMAESVRNHRFASESLLSTGFAEAVVRAEYAGVACQIRMDWFDPNKGIVDLKTVDNIEYFESDARRYGYLHQLAFYRGVLEAASGDTYRCYFIAVEKREPYRTGVWKVLDDVLTFATKENLAAIKRLQLCQQCGAWNTGYEELRHFDSL